MALTFAKVADSDQCAGRFRSAVWDVTMDNSYPTGGEAVTAASVGLKRIIGARFLGGNAAAGVFLWHWDTAAGKIMAFCPTGGATAPTTVVAPVAAAPAVGTFAVTTTPDAGGTTMTGSAAKPALVGVISGALAAPALTAGIAKEYGNTGDLSTCAVRFEFYGI